MKTVIGIGFSIIVLAFWLSHRIVRDLESCDPALVTEQRDGRGFISFGCARVKGVDDDAKR